VSEKRKVCLALCCAAIGIFASIAVMVADVAVIQWVSEDEGLAMAWASFWLTVAPLYILLGVGGGLCIWWRWWGRR